MSDLVASLREDAKDHRLAWEEDDSGSLITATLLEQAADRIEQLERERDEYKADARLAHSKWAENANALGEALALLTEARPYIAEMDMDELEPFGLLARINALTEGK